ncbi:TonB-dependent receptor [Aminobacter sp. DSM 101952]|uniref:TonB-dependent receptor n=1 Tax=Aminobacter sp. DSM 101952 TaxID=2735891 RepID=UPI0006F5F655|nr:TonB-dependent receptor [Aminobacter sp. DSM 101952]KQU62801.1 TonB-dependent receptor [Aminobacter sp. DSM 101952]
MTGKSNRDFGGTASGRLLRRLLMGTALGAGMLVATVPYAPAQAQSAQMHSINLPAQPLAQSLKQLAAQTGLQIAFGTADIGSARAPAVSGNISAEQALGSVLSGSGLNYRFTGPNTVSIQSATASAASGGLNVAANGAVVLNTIDINAQGGEGGVNHVQITAEDLARKNPADLQEVFADEPKIAVGSSLPMSQKVYVQGIEETNLAVTVDGARQNNKVFHHNATNLIDPSLLKAVSVDAGVAPADAGPGALGGAIAYETKDARDLLEPGKSIGGLVTGTYDFNSKTHTVGLSAYGIEGGFEYFGYLNFAKGDNYTAGNGATIDGTSANLLSGIGKVAYQAEDGHRFELSHEQLRDDAPRPFRANMSELDPPKYWEPPIRDYKLDRSSTVFTYTDETPEGWWDPKVVIAYTSARVETLIYPRPVPPSTESDTYPGVGKTESFNGKAENRFALDMGSITAGLDFYKDSADLDAREDSSTEYASNVGLYAQARLEPWDRTRLSFGARGDNQWFEGTTGEKWTNAGLSGNISGEYDLVPDFLTAKAGYSHVWAGVPLAENFNFNPNWNYGDGPKPVTSDNLTAGLVATYQGFTLEAGIFRTDIYDGRTAYWAPGRAIEAHDVRSQGFTLGGGYDWGAGNVSVKYANIDVTIDGAPADSYLGNYLATPVGQIFTLAAVHRFDDWGVTVGGDVEIALDYDKVPAGSKKIEGHEVVNVFVEYQPPSNPNLTFRGEVKNLFDEDYASRATYGQEFGDVKPLLEPGRSFRLSATAKF